MIHKIMQSVGRAVRRHRASYCGRGEGGGGQGGRPGEQVCLLGYKGGLGFDR